MCHGIRVAWAVDMRSIDLLKNIVLSAIACGSSAISCGSLDTPPGTWSTTGMAQCFPSLSCFSPADAWGFAPVDAGAEASPDASLDGDAVDASAGADAAARATCPVLTNIPTCGPGTVESGPIEQNGKCCYTYQVCACTGRPFVVQGEARVADAARRRDWRALTPSLPEGAPLAVAREWLGDALLEHASIASFARLALDLLALGAPADLVHDTMRAASDEIEHAKVCFALASTPNAPVGPGALATDDACSRADLTALAVATAREGCVGETLGALVASERARCTRQPMLKRALARIAADEARHAALAWRIVRWAIESGGAPVRRAVTAAFADALAALSARRATSNHRIDAAVWHAHGRLTPLEELSLARRGAREIVEPCASALARETQNQPRTFTPRPLGGASTENEIGLTAPRDAGAVAKSTTDARTSDPPAT
jgi:hypothetical protein